MFEFSKFMFTVNFSCCVGLINIKLTTNRRDSGDLLLRQNNSCCLPLCLAGWVWWFVLPIFHGWAPGFALVTRLLGLDRNETKRWLLGWMEGKETGAVYSCSLPATQKHKSPTGSRSRLRLHFTKQTLLCFACWHGWSNVATSHEEVLPVHYYYYDDGGGKA